MNRRDPRTVAALYVEPRGVYANLPGVEVWDEARDARTYAGPRVAIAAQNARVGLPPTGEPVDVKLQFCHQRPQSHFSKKGGLTPMGARHIWHDKTPDLDKLARCILDALAGIVYEDDKQVVLLACEDIWAPEGGGPGVRIAVERIEWPTS